MVRGKTCVIYGAPGSGKTTLSKTLAGSGDVVFDLDLIAAAIGMSANYPRPFDHSQMLLGMREGFIRVIEERGTESGNVFIIVTDGDAARKIATRLKADLVTPQRQA